MTPEEIAEIEERCQRASPAPWTEGPTTYHLADADGMLLAEFDDSRVNYDADLAFVREAREDVPALVAEVRRLRQENERLRRTSLPHMCRDGHEEIRHAGEDELCPVCRAKNEAERAREDRDAAVHAAQANTAELARAWKERDAALAEVARLREALDAAQRIVKRKADREAGREET